MYRYVISCSVIEGLQLLLMCFFQKYWSGLPFPPPEDFPNPGIEPRSPVSPSWAGGFFTSELPGQPWQITGTQILVVKRMLCFLYDRIEMFRS